MDPFSRSRRALLDLNLTRYVRDNLSSFVCLIEADSLDKVAGPDRPPPPTASTMTPTDPTKSPQWSAEALLAQSSRIGSDLYSRLAAAVTERGYVKC